MQFAGVLNARDAKAYKTWWTARGHSVTLERFNRGSRRLYRVYLTLNRNQA